MADTFVGALRNFFKSDNNFPGESPGDFVPHLVCHFKKMEEQRISAGGKGICWCQREAEVQKKRQGALLREKNAEEGQEHQWTGKKIFKNLV